MGRNNIKIIGKLNLRSEEKMKFKNKLGRVLIASSLVVLLSSQTYAQPSEWAKVEVRNAIELELVPKDLMSKYKDNITREEFASMAVKLYSAISGKEAPVVSQSLFSDTSNKDILAANKLGIITGVGGERFAPNDSITREQLSVMIYRTLQITGAEAKSYPVKYADSTEISDWAKEAIAFMSHRGVIAGVGENKVAPKALVTREQAIIMSLRSFKEEPKVEEPPVKITDSTNAIILKGKRIALGDTLVNIEKSLGKANRIDSSGYDYKWHVYNSDYSNFIMVGIKDGIVDALYTNTKGFQANKVSYGDININDIGIKSHDIKFYRDTNDNNKIHACLITPKGQVEKESHSNEFYRAQELENFDATNVFRVNHGLSPLKLEEVATTTARNYSQEMADTDRVDHIDSQGRKPRDRFEANGGVAKATGENISGGRLLGIDSFDGFVNSAGHRMSMLGKYKHLGVGYGHNQSSKYKNIITQFFWE